MECSWCHQKIEDESTAREISFLGRDFILCPEDFQLIWNGFAGINALIKQFRALNVGGKR